jgi:hypothetical protein
MNSLATLHGNIFPFFPAPLPEELQAVQLENQPIKLNETYPVSCQAVLQGYNTEVIAFYNSFFHDLSPNTA